MIGGGWPADCAHLRMRREAKLSKFGRYWGSKVKLRRLLLNHNRALNYMLMLERYFDKIICISYQLLVSPMVLDGCAYPAMADQL
jgi:hypothetical protein